MHQYLERLESKDGFEPDLSTRFWEESLIPKIKQHYFQGVTIDSLLEKSIALYRSNSDRTLALALVWQEVEWKFPFDSETYGGFVERLEQLLKNEPNPPTESDWEYLDDHLMK